MSWFNIAKSALSQAQRSIDKVLDIEQENSDNNQERSGQVPTPKSNTSRSTEPTAVDHSKSDNTDGSSFWSSFNTLKPGTHSTPKAGHSQASSTDYLSFDEDSHWGGYFSPPQPKSLPSSTKSTPKRNNSLERPLNKRDKTSPTLLESSEATQSLPSPTIKTSKSGPLKLSSSKNKSHPKAKQADSGKQETKADDDDATKVTKELVTSSSDNFTATSVTDDSTREVTKELVTSSSDSFIASDINENVEKEQKPVDTCIHTSQDDHGLQPVTTSELLLLASAENDKVLCSSDVNRGTGTQPDTPSIPVQLITEEVDSTLAVSPVMTSEPVENTNEDNIAAVPLGDTEIDKVKSESNSYKEPVSSSPVPIVAEGIITTPHSDEVSSTAEYVIVSKETIVNKPESEPVIDNSLQSVELLQTTEAVFTSNSVTEQKDELQEEDKLEDRQTELVSDGGNSSNVEMHKLEDDNNEISLPANDDAIPTVSDGSQGSGDSHVQSHDKNYEEEFQQLKNEVVRLNELLTARETKLVELSKENVNMRETEVILRNQLQQAEDNLKADQTGIEELKEEFTKRISTSEKKLQAVIKERDSLKNQVQMLHKDQKTSAEKQLAEELALTKEQVTGLMEEGERLSKQQLQSNNIIKKLKAKDKESEKLITSLRQQVSENESEIEKLSEALKKKDEKEKKYQESVAQLNTIAEQQAKELTTLKAECETLTDKARGLQTNLDNAYKEMAELHKTNALSQNAAQEATLSAEIAAKEQLKVVLEQHKMEARREQETLSMQLADLQMSLKRNEHQINWKEEHYKQEIADLQQRLQEAESRNQELTQSVSQATRPLLRQIENLQSVHNAQTINWERVEESLSEKLVDLQSQLNTAIAREHAAVERERVMESKLKGIETQMETFKQAKSQLVAALEMEKAKAEAVQEELDRERAKHNSLKNSYTHTLTETRKEKEALQREMEYERIKAENEIKKLVQEAQEKEREKLASTNRMNLSRTSSGGSNHSQGNTYDRSMSLDGYSTGVGSLASASAVDRLQSTLKQKEGELHNVQELVTSLERSRESLANDLASTSAQVQSLQEELKSLPVVRNNLQKLQKNYDALLQMYGEKAEEAEELKLDLLDVKAMYRSQIEELLNKQR